MTTTWDDAARDMALQDLHDEAVMKQATRAQCIFLFVEGDSEAKAIPELLYDAAEFESLGTTTGGAISLRCCDFSI